MSKNFLCFVCNCHPNLADAINSLTSAENSLLEASKKGDLEEVQRLISRNVNVNCENRYGSTPLIMSSISGKLEVAEILIENGADVNHSQYQDWTALHGACFFGHIHLVCLLIMRGANTKVVNNEGKRPGEQFDQSVGYAAALEIQNILNKGLAALPEYRELLQQDETKSNDIDISLSASSKV
mmetsp:Transcript_26081/g.34232  ORF Transcript_26081/g.34232 Transcript_26081/m.34232 type:complete len:183 (+) Transcript_26081:78-626(+)